MKRRFFISLFVACIATVVCAQKAGKQELQQAVSKLNSANTAKDYANLAQEFSAIANTQKKQWLPYYYAAFCNAKVGWLKQTTDPDNIESFADQADQQIKEANALIDTATQKAALSEIYCVLSMINRARVFINPMTYGRQYGPLATRYMQQAEKINPDNPRALYLAGWEKFAAPKMYGGDKTKAKEILLKARQNLDNSKTEGPEPSWGKKEVEDLLKKLK